MKPHRPVCAILVCAPAVALTGQNFDPSPFVNLVAIFMVVAIVAMIVLIPRIYRRMLDKEGGDKNLNQFLLNDPATRDLLLKKRGVKPTAASPAQPTPAKPAPRQHETPDDNDPFVDLGEPPPPKPKK